tara:strand:+ start:8119 stop:8736 length:618 start_codon:yes stop_codon:yes gene_type:complete
MSNSKLITAKSYSCALLAAVTLVLSSPYAVAHSKTSSHHHQDQHTADEHEHEHEHDEFSSPGTHVHGLAGLTLVLEGNELMLALQSAAYNIVGFEHSPKNAEQRQEINAALEVLRQGTWFSINSQAGCDVTEGDANTDLVADVSSAHGDFYANISLLCQQPARFDTLTVNLFNLVPSLEKISVQWVINGRQGAAELSLTNNSISF